MQKLSLTDVFSITTGTLAFFGIDYLFIVKMLTSMGIIKNKKFEIAHPYIKGGTYALGGAFIISLLCYIPWSDIHIEKQKTKIIYRDTPKTSRQIEKADIPLSKKNESVEIKKTLKQKKDTPTQPKEVITSPQPSVSAKNVITGGTFISPVHNGDTYEGIKQRRVTNMVIDYVVSKITDKKLRIAVKIPNSSAESENYAEELIKILNSKGYMSIYMVSGSDTYYNGDVHVEYDNGRPMIYISPAKDVQ